MGGGGGGMSWSLPDCEERIAAGAVGISPCRRARGPVGIDFATSPLTPSLNETLFLRELFEFDELEDAVIPFRSVPFGAFDLRSPSTSFARFSRASFSRWALDKNLGYRI